ncbi:MFS transporter [Lentilactobacillus sp. IMAU92037]|uniref:MFS transporter n=1 Tax=Lentilactobacillus TaxID=2767893 RepID=UPI001C25188B|nr:MULTISPECIES: MFS transporter [Lentilactobacillus]MBU9789688.1 MFS transporter [Lentilactobacillus dabitei]MBV0931473.1 MFS transporter [Lentilactobacillus dabitei]MDM7516622.1 MFS transporter [Lentilactobacillus sp. TOM.63]
MDRQITKKLYLAIIATGLMAFCGVLIETAMNITFPTLMKEFNVPTATIQWLTTSYLMIVSIFVPISSYLKKRFTTRQLFLTANLLFIIGLLIDTFSSSFGILVVGRLVQGSGTGIALPLMYNIILDQAPLNKIGFLMGIGTLVTAIAPALGPTYGGLLVDYNWHLIFAFLLIFMLISLGCGLYAINPAKATGSAKLDWLGWGEIAIGFVSLIIGFSSLSNSFMRFCIFLIIGIACVILFVHHSNHVPNPIINLRVMENASFNFHLLSYFLIQILVVGIAFVLPNYMQIVNHTSATIAGLALLPGAAIGACLAPIGGKIYDRLGPTKPILTGLTFQLISVVLLTGIVKNATTPIITIAYTLTMLGIGFAAGNIMTNGLNQITRENNADGNALFSTMQQFAGAAGTSIVSVIFGFFQGSATGSYVSNTIAGARYAFIYLISIVLINSLSIIMGLIKSHRHA